ncbi:sensor histidine kinase [Phycicoccus ginsengisoli]
MALNATSLRARVTLGTAAAAALAMGLLVSGLVLAQSHAEDIQAQTVLTSRVSAAASTVVVGVRAVRVLETPADTLDEGVWVFAADGSLLDGATPPRALATVVTSLGSAGAKPPREVAGRYLVTSRTVKRPDGTSAATVVGALDLRPYTSGTKRLTWLGLILAAAATAATAGAAWAATGRALHRVRAMAVQADQWRDHHDGHRFPAGGRDELADLGRTLNRMLDRISSALDSERRLTDGVAHELRTPLSVIRAEAQLAHPIAEQPTSASLEAILRATDRMDASIETLLRTARHRSAIDDVCDVDQVLASLVAAAHRPGDVVVRIAPAQGQGARRRVHADLPAELLTAILSPLIDNAVRHAPHSVTISRAVTGSVVRVRVDDDGPGIPEADVQSVFEAGVTTQADGSGLGLPLSRRLARAAGGTVSAEPGPGGHLVVELRAVRRPIEGPGNGVQEKVR